MESSSAKESAQTASSGRRLSNAQKLALQTLVIEDTYSRNLEMDVLDIIQATHHQKLAQAKQKYRNLKSAKKAGFLQQLQEECDHVAQNAQKFTSHQLPEKTSMLSIIVGVIKKEYPPQPSDELDITDSCKTRIENLAAQFCPNHELALWLSQIHRELPRPKSAPVGSHFTSLIWEETEDEE
jgi:hypothetical protein